MSVDDVPLEGFDFISGDGDFAAVSSCLEETFGVRSATLADALRHVEGWDTWGCGEGCTDRSSRHRAVAVTNGSNR